MDQSEFDDLVTQSEAVTDADVEPIVRATLETLGEALAAGRADDVARRLPDSHAETLTAPGGRPEAITYEDFLERVRDREDARGRDDEEVRARIGAVTDALATTVPHGELLDLRSQLPDEIGSLFTEGAGVR